ncbi:hypothetical protein [Candidatus Wolbachia massiliensis]|uniref:Uncharacterized protein n=1 Tax=Candidatus Wolbachia massiliensis TaxID=1845000 RepID=A0A7M3U210_9RICK|nr:hypothetical protein [Candidatus Wolbachia massiliensis]QOD38445.1 hypothetical protein ID128_00810 [Candidatus Wolbachia massiliensis]
MTAGLSFKNASGAAATSLDEVKIITLEDKTGNKYTLDIEGTELELKYKPQGGSEIKYNVTGLVPSITSLLTTNSGSKNGTRDITIFEKEAANKDVVEAILKAKASSTDTESIFETKVAGKEVAGKILGAKDGKKSILVEQLGGSLANSGKAKYDGTNEQTAQDFLASKYPFVKTDASNLTDAKAFAEKILPAQDGKKSILVEQLGESLTSLGKAKYDGSNDQTAQEFLASKYPFVKTADLATKVSEKAVVDVLVPALATAGTDDTKKVYTKTTADAAFVKTADLATKVSEKDVVEAILKAKASSTDTESIFEKEVAGKEVAGKILGAKDGTKSILVEQLGGSLASSDKAKYDGSNDQTAKEFLGSKGFPSAAAVATQLLTDANKDKLGKAVLGVKKKVNDVEKPALETDLAANKDFQKDVAADSGLKAAVASPTIAANADLQKAVATKLLDDTNKNNLGKAVLGVTKKVNDVDKPALETDLAANTDLQTAVKNALAADTGFQNATKITVGAEDPELQGAVRIIASQPMCEIESDGTFSCHLFG